MQDKHTHLTRPQLRVLAILVDGPARQSNATRPDRREVAWRTVRALEKSGLAIDVAGHSAILTDAGKIVAADPPAPPPFRYDHGTHACYTLDSCDCAPCTTAASEYEMQRTKDLAYGRPRTVDAEPVRAHVRDLMCARTRGAHHGGVGLKQIAKVSGVSHGALWKLMYGAPDRQGPSKRLRTSTAEKLLAVGPQHMADGATVSARHTISRLTDLRDAGATWTEIGEQLGTSPSNTHALATRRNVTAGTARAVHHLWSRWQAGEWKPTGRRPGGHAKAKLEREATDA